MKKIRTGNDIHIIWTITKNDEILESFNDLNLEGAEIQLIDSFNHPATFNYAITTIDENTAQVVGTFFGKDQKTQGKYRLLLVKNKGEEGMITLDFVDAFILTCVSKFGVVSGNDESSITTATIELESSFSSYNGSPDMTGYFTKDEVLELLSNYYDKEYINNLYNDTWTIEETINYIDWQTSQKQDILVSGQNIKTINGESLVGGGNITIKGGEDYDISEHIDDATIIENGDAKLQAQDAILSSGFTVQGVTVGNLENGKEIAAGTTVWGLLKQMLMKVLDVIATNPTITMTSPVSTSSVYEVGTVLTPQFSYQTTSGEFNGQQGYDYSLDAGCVWSNIRYYKGSNSFTNSSSYNFEVAEGENSFKVRGDYSANTNTPVKNNGEESSVKISATTNVDSSQIKYTGCYKYFILNYNPSEGVAPTVQDLTSDIVRGNGQYSTKQIRVANLTKDGTTTFTTEKTSNGESIIIACPQKYKLSAIQYSNNASMLDNFSVKGTMTLNIGGSSTSVYNVYIFPITNDTPVSFKNVTFTKS